LALSVMQNNKNGYLNVTTTKYISSYNRYFTRTNRCVFSYRIPASMLDNFKERYRKANSKFPVQFPDRLLTIESAARIYRDWFPRTMTFEEWIKRQDITLYEEVVR